MSPAILPAHTPPPQPQQRPSPETLEPFSDIPNLLPQTLNIINSGDLVPVSLSK